MKDYKSCTCRRNSDTRFDTSKDKAQIEACFKAIDVIGFIMVASLITAVVFGG